MENLTKEDILAVMLAGIGFLCDNEDCGSIHPAPGFTIEDVERFILESRAQRNRRLH